MKFVLKGNHAESDCYNMTLAECEADSENEAWEKFKTVLESQTEPIDYWVEKS